MAGTQAIEAAFGMMRVGGNEDRQGGYKKLGDGDHNNRLHFGSLQCLIGEHILNIASVYSLKIIVRETLPT
jgi:hypothetical protein